MRITAGEKLWEPAKPFLSLLLCIVAISRLPPINQKSQALPGLTKDQSPPLFAPFPYLTGQLYQTDADPSCSWHCILHKMMQQCIHLPALLVYYEYAFQCILMQSSAILIGFNVHIQSMDTHPMVSSLTGQTLGTVLYMVHPETGLSKVWAVTW